MKKIMLLILMMLLVIPLVNAATWDNVLDYENEDLIVKITNWFGLFGWLGLDDEIGMVELKSHSSVDEIRKVGTGNQVVMWYDFNFVELYLNGLGEIEFTDMKTGKEIDRNYSFVYWGEKERDVYGEGECFYNINGTKNCETIVIRKQTYDDWLPYNSRDIPKGNIRIGLMTYVEVGDKIDGIWTIAGKKVSKHAEWTADLNVGLVRFYQLNATAGAVIDCTGNNDGTNNGADRGVVGLINNSFDFDGLNDDNINGIGNFTYNTTLTDFSFSLWINASSLTSSPSLISSDINNDAPRGIQLLVAADGTLQFFDGNSVSVATGVGAITTGSFIHIIYTNDLNAGKLYINGVSVKNDTSNLNNVSKELTLGLRSPASPSGDFDGKMDEVGFWNRTLSGAEVVQLNNGGSGITCTEILVVSIDLNSPLDNLNTTNQTIDFNGTAVISTIAIANVSLILNNSYNGTNSSGINNTEYIFTRTLDFGSYNWTMEVCNTADLCVNATLRSFTIDRFIEQAFTFNASSLETETETFFVNITTNGTVPTNGKLIYNGTSNTASITNTAGNDYNLSATINIPTIAETKPFFFNLTINGVETSTSTQTQLINLTNFTFCLAGMTYINISFKNETVSEELVTAQIDADWTYWLGSGGIFKTLTHTNASENLNYTFCLEDYAQNRTLNTNVSLTYDNSISEQRSFSSDFILNNDTTNLTLFLLPTVDGIFITFQVVTVAEQVISGVDINVTKNSVIVETGITDAAGLKAFFLDPDTTYGFSFFKSGFDVFTTSLAPTQTTFTVTLGRVAGDVINDTTKGISYFINPTINVLANNTAIEFNLTFASSFWALDSFAFFLKNSTGTFFNSTSSTTDTGGFLTQTLNTGDNTDLIMEITWTINGNQTNVTRTWIVRNFEDEGFSIKTFFDDLSTYLTSNMFGLTSFGLGIIIFLIITLVTGVLSVKFGITSPPGIAIIVFALVAFFDVALGIMPNPVNAVPNFPTIFMGVVFLGTFIKEAIVR